MKIQKKYRYHLIFLVVMILFLFTTYFFFGRNSINNERYEGQSAAAAATYAESSFPRTEKIDRTGLASIYPDMGKSISSTSAIFYSDNTGFIDDAPNFPTILMEDKTNTITFVNSDKQVVKSISTDLLHLENLLDESGITYDPELHNYPHVSPVVLENPKGVFYFSATNSYGCGASNCTWVLYRFDSNTGKLEVMDINVFGVVMGLYLSPDFKEMALVKADTGGTCDDSFHVSIYNLQDFKKQEVGTFTDIEAESRRIENLEWKRNNEIQFDVNYSTCLVPEETIIKWSYDTAKNQIQKLKSETIKSEWQ
jgi:hypothetical protein